MAAAAPAGPWWRSAGGLASDGGSDDGAGILIQDGTQATIANAGTITSVLGTEGTAIRVVDRTASIVNIGTTTGQISKASSIDWLNRPGAWIDSGSLLDVDTLSNQGTLAPAGVGRVGANRVTGDLTQSTSGVFAVDLNPNASASAGAADHLSVGGRASFGGLVAVNLLDVWQSNAGPHAVPILSADGGLSVNGLAVTPSAVAQYRLLRPTPGLLSLAYGIDFANLGIVARTNDNQDDIARHIHAIDSARALDDKIARGLIAIEDTTTYAWAMNSLSSEVVVDNQIASLLAGIRFNDDLLGCAGRGGDLRYLDEGQCRWLRLGGQRLTQPPANDNLGFNENSWQIAGGGEVAIGNGWAVAGALAYESSSLSVDDSNTGSGGDRVQVGVSAKRRFGASELSGSLAIGCGDYEVSRSLWPGVASDGSEKLGFTPAS